MSPNARNLKLINYFAVLSTAWAYVPILLPFCQTYLGVGFKEMIFSESIFAASCVLFDVPMGWVSDIWKRKYALMLGALLNMGGAALLLIADNVWYLYASQAITGIGISLFNGTHTALLYDTLLTLDREGEYRRREGKRQAFALYGYAAVSAISGFLYAWHPLAPFWLAVLSFAGTIVVISFMNEPPRLKKSTRAITRDIALTLRDVVIGRSEVGFAILFAAILFSATKTISWTQQPYFQAIDIPIAYYGVLMSVGWLLGGMASHLAHKLDGKVDNIRLMVLTWALAIFMCAIAAAWVSGLGVIIVMLAGSCLYGAMSPRVNEIINKHAESANRASLLSTQTFLTSLLFIPISSFVGWASDASHIRYGLLSIALWLLAGVYGLFWLKGRRILTGGTESR